MRPHRLLVRVDRGTRPDVALPTGSPFENWEEARPFAGPLPFTFGVEPDGERVVLVEGVRSHWEPRPLRVVDHRVPFVEELTRETPVLASPGRRSWRASAR